MSRKKTWSLILGGLSCVVLGVAGYLTFSFQLDPYVALYSDNCSQCHGADLAGTAQGPALLNAELARGDSVSEMVTSIKHAHLPASAAALSETLSDVQIKGLAIYLGERRLGLSFTNFQFDRPITLPEGPQVTDHHTFYIEPFADNLDPLVFSIAPLPDGSILLTEKERGLSIVSPAGEQGALIQGTPETGASMNVMGVQYGSGWLLDIAPHPQYEDNGWLYLHYTHLCGETCDGSIMPSSMNRLDRGRIIDGQWQDTETLWQAPYTFYSPTPDTGAGGRIAFDDAGHVFISVGIKASGDNTADVSAQALDNPYGKVHRLHDDGSIPLDNPFRTRYEQTPATAVLRSIWTFGHRSPQGLEWHPLLQRVWNSEMGPRGGDEINELLPGQNYGWPYHSLGLEYSTRAVERHKNTATEFDPNDIQHTLVDITPSPAISSFVFYSGQAFPNWRHDVLIGSLKGGSLYRMAFDGTSMIHRETLINNLARIRDIEVGYDGLIYLLLESKSGSGIVRLRPVDNHSSDAV